MLLKITKYSIFQLVSLPLNNYHLDIPVWQPDPSSRASVPSPPLLPTVKDLFITDDTDTCQSMASADLPANSQSRERTEESLTAKPPESAKAQKASQTDSREDTPERNRGEPSAMPQHNDTKNAVKTVFLRNR